MPAKHLVYILKNADPAPHFYVGLSTDVDARVLDHNMGRCSYTASRRPWRRHVVIEFPDEPTAIAFERYMKSGSGRAFAKRHFERHASRNRLPYAAIAKLGMRRRMPLVQNGREALLNVLANDARCEPPDVMMASVLSAEPALLCEKPPTRCYSKS